VIAKPEGICLACDAARRDAADLYFMAVEDGVTSDRIQHLVSSMDGERAWRVALFMAGIAAGITQELGEQVELAPLDIAHVMREEMTLPHDHHGEHGQ
jgi:hypothetical protein